MMALGNLTLELMKASFFVINLQGKLIDATIRD